MSGALGSSLTERPYIFVEREQHKSEYWDIQVGDTHNYVTADGCIHHNSGKTFAGCWEILRRAMATPPDPDGVRYSRCAVIRATFRQLESTTIPTYKRLFSKHFGIPVKRVSGYNHVIHTDLPDGTTVHCEVIFFPLASEQDIDNLMSLELTMAFINEARFLPKAVFTALMTRFRYPGKDQGVSGAWSGWWADTNAPDTDSWIYKTFEEDHPPGWEMYRQPGGLIRDGNKEWVPNEKAENIPNLDAGIEYYVDAQHGMEDDEISVLLGNNYGFIKEGKLIIPEFNDFVHVAKKPLEFSPKLKTIYVGIDFGLTPAATFLQLDPYGQWLAIEEMNSDDALGIKSFGENHLKPRMNELGSRGFNFVVTGDPAGEQGAQTDGKTPFQQLEDIGINAQPAYTNDFEIRRSTIATACRTGTGNGDFCFLLSPKCPIMRKGFNQKYVYVETRKDLDPRGVVHKPQPLKNSYSHGIESCEYGMMGGGAGKPVDTHRGQKRERRRGNSHRQKAAVAVV